MKSLAVIFLTIFISFTSFAQSQNISGKIVDENHLAIEFANVLLLNVLDSSLVKGQVTNENGLFTFQEINEGTYIVHSSFVGVGKFYTDPFTVNTSDVDLKLLTLSNGINIDEVAIVAKKPFIEMQADKMVVNVANSALSAGNSALEVIAKSPGIILDNNNNISLRGKEGVLVMINGKQQYFTGEALTRFLDNMPATNIQKIEIINNPSAKYEAEGNSGIINIVLKKNENLGMNGSVSSTARQGRAFSHFQNANINYRSEKVNVYGSFEYFDWGKEKDLFLERTIPFEGQNTVFDQETNFLFDGRGTNTNIGLDYFVTSNTSLSLLFKDNRENETEFSDNLTLISGANAPLFEKLSVINNGDISVNNQTINTNITHKFNDAGYEISFDADYNFYKNESKYDYDNFFLNLEDDPIQDPFYLRNKQYVDIDIFASKVDLSLPINDKLKIEIGSKYSYVNTLNETVFEYLDGETWVNQENRTNDFMYTENVLAFYANSQSKLGKYSIQAGLRAEQTFSTGESITLDQPVNRSYLDFFPSLSISRTFNEKHSVGINYSRRLERPNYKDLNPFEFFLDQYTFSKGNPFLNPQYTNSISANYAYGNAFFMAVDYSRTKDVIFEILEQKSDENLTFQTTLNLDNTESFSVTLSKPVVWNEWFVSRANYTTYYSSFSSETSSGSFVNSNIAHFINVGNEISLPNKWNLEIGANYQTGVVWGLFFVTPRGSVDIGISKKLLNDRGSLKIAVDDLFNTQNSRVSIMQNDLNVIVDQYDDNRRVKATFSYNFGNNKVKAARKRQTASSAEGNRL